MSKPECDYIKGIPPAIAIEQKVNTRNPRSTVGTSTEIYEYLRLLYARVREDDIAGFRHRGEETSGERYYQRRSCDIPKELVLPYSLGCLAGRPGYEGAAGDLAEKDMPVCR